MDVMRTVQDVLKCCACNACANICSQNAIKIKTGFEQSKIIIDENLCTKCGLCWKICPTINKVQKRAPLDCLQGWVKSERKREAAASGGIASALYDAFIQSGGTICGCVFEKGSFKLKLSDSYETIEKFTGSKYVKSDVGNIYDEIRRLLKNDEKVLFVGLPCQVAGLLNYIPFRYQTNLFTVDLICHGTPSIKLLEKHLLEKGFNISNVEMIKFRKGNEFYLNVDGQDVTKYGMLDSYMFSFLHSLIYTDNCYSCNYATIERCSDLTIGDAWGSDLQENEKNKGISVVFYQTEKGKKLLDLADLELRNFDIELAFANNKQLSKPAYNEKRQLFFYTLRNEGSFSGAVRKCYPKVFFRQKIKGILNCLCKSMR